MTASPPGRYCLATCYCGTCAHWEPYELSPREVRQLITYLARPPRYENNKPSPRWWAEPPGARR